MNLREKIVGIMGEVGAIGKDQSAKGLEYSFRSIDAVLAKVQPLLTKYGVFYVPTVKDLKIETRTERRRRTYEGQSYDREIAHMRAIATVDYTVHDSESDEMLTVTVIGEGLDNSDKACAKALTYAQKAFLIQLLAIPAQDVIDPDYERPGENGYEAPAPKGPATPYPQPAEGFKQPSPTDVNWADVVPANARSPKTQEAKCLQSLWEYYLKSPPPGGMDPETLCHSIWEQWNAWPASESDCDVIIHNLKIKRA